MRVVQSEFKAASAKFGDFGKSTDSLKLKSDALNKQIDLQKQKVAALSAAYAKSAQDKGKDADATENLAIKLNKANAQLSKMETDLNKTNKELQSQSSVVGKLGKDYQDSFKQAQESMGNTFDRAQATGAAMSGVGLAITAGLGSAVKTTMDFEYQMSNVKAVTGASQADFIKLTDLAKEMGSTTKFSASEAAEAMSFLGMAGFKTNQIMSALPDVLNLAAAGALDLGDAADISSNIMSGFNIKAEEMSRVSDVLAKTAASSNTNIQQLGYGMKYLAPVANSLGWSLEESAAAIGIFSDAGIQGEMAGQAFSTSLQRLSKPTAAMETVMSDLGISFFNANGEMKSLTEIVPMLESKFNGLTDQQRQSAISTLFGAEAAKHWLTLLSDGSKDIVQFTNELKNSEGAAGQMAKTMSDNMKGSMDSLKSAFEGAQISLGEALAPAIRRVADIITSLVNAFNNLSPTAQKIIAVIGAIAGIFLLLAGPILMLIGFLPMIAAGFSMLTGPIGLVIAAIAALIAIVVLVIVYWDEIKAFFVATWEWISQKAVEIWSGLVDFFTGLWDGIKQTFMGIWSPIVSYYSAVFQTIWAIISSYWEMIKAYFAAVFLTIYYLFTGEWGKIGEVWKAFAQKVVKIATELWDKIKGIWTTLWTNLKKWTSDGINAIVNWFKSLPGRIMNSISNMKSQLQNFWSNLKTDAVNAGKNMIQGMINGVASMAKSLVNKVKGVVNDAVKAAKNLLGIKSPSRVFMQIGEDTGRGLEIGLDSKLSDIVKKSSQLADAATFDVDPIMKSGMQPEIVGVSGTSGEITINNYNNFDNVVINNDTDLEQLSERVSQRITQKTQRMFKTPLGGGLI